MSYPSCDRSRAPHPIPYQGSKRVLAPTIGGYIPADIATWFEPFAGSAAMTIWAARRGLARRYVIGDSLDAIARLWTSIIEHPERTTSRYEAIWREQRRDNPDYFNEIRDRYNKDKDPVDLLYLTCRCVKNAVRFNASGNFSQSVDKRRLGMRPAKMRLEIMTASTLLRGRTEVVSGDWMETVANAAARDFVYLDPPYLGTSVGSDKRYAEQVEQEKIIDGLRCLIHRQIRFVLSYDGMTGKKEYGPALPPELRLNRIFLYAGRSAQATLNGQNAQTIESLYLSPGLYALSSRDSRLPPMVQDRLAL